MATQDETPRVIACEEFARPEIVRLIQRANADHGGWKLFTLDNGDLIFGCYPQAETYEAITQSPNGGAI